MSWPFRSGISFADASAQGVGEQPRVADHYERADRNFAEIIGDLDAAVIETSHAPRLFAYEIVDRLARQQLRRGGTEIALDPRAQFSLHRTALVDRPENAGSKV
jgi:hypothetical protein